jgi:ribosomal protein S17E
MDLNSFKSLREKYLNESLEYNENPRLYEFLSSKYDQPVNEGIFNSVINWFKRNFSPTARKIQDLGVEYYDWLMAEYNATYKGNDTDEKEIDKFLKAEKISSDIEQQINDVAGDSEAYKELAKKVITKYKMKAKKDFSTKLLGPESLVTQGYSKSYGVADKDLKLQTDEMTAEGAKTFNKLATEVETKIKSQGKTREIAKLISLGLMQFFQNRLSIKKMKYSLDDIMKEYDKGEDALMASDKFFNTYKGAQLLYAARIFQYDWYTKDNSEMTLSGKQLDKWIKKALQDLEDIGIENPKELWGFTLLYVSQRNSKEAKETLDLIEKSIEGKNEEELQEMSKDLETKVNEALKEANTVESQTLLVNKIEKDLETEEKADDKKESSPEDDTQDQEKKKETDEPDEKDFPKVKKLVEELSDDQTKKAAFSIVQFALKAIATAEVKGDKVYMNSNFIKDPLFTDDQKGIPTAFDLEGEQIMMDGKAMTSSQLEEIKKEYGLEVEEGGKVKYNENVQKASDALLQDFVNCVKLFKDRVENARDNEVAYLKSPNFVTSMFVKGKKFSKDPIEDTKKLEETYRDLFYEELSPSNK